MGGEALRGRIARHRLVALLLLAACGGTPAATVPSPAASQELSSTACPSGIQAAEVFRGGRWFGRDSIDVAAAAQGTVPDTIIWSGQLFVPYRAARALADASSPGAPRLVRAGFDRSGALYADPAELPDVQDLHLLDERSCALRSYRRVECTTESRLGISVKALDARTEQPPPDGYTLIVRQGGEIAGRAAVSEAVQWQTTGWKDRGLEAVYDSAGTFALEVRAPGYHSWRAGNIVVRPGRCHVETVFLTAYLEAVTSR